MAKIVGAITTSHVPAIGGAIHKGLQSDPYWKPFFNGFPPIREWLAKVKPDVAIVVNNDHGLNFFLDKMPTFAIGTAPEYRNADEGWGIPVLPPFKGDEDLSWHLAESLIGEEFDMVTCQEMLVDHAFTLPLALLYPDMKWPVRVVPININTVLFPTPSAKRCYKLGQAIGRAVEAFDKDIKVLVIGTGGLSHQLDGERAGFINKEFDLMCMEKIVGEPQALARYSTLDLVRLAGAQGVELVNWLVARGALTGSVSKVHANYHIPISNTATGMLVLENRA
jgi:protocatechuate 4,5-dioxygenase beta chain